MSQSVNSTIAAGVSVVLVVVFAIVGVGTLDSAQLTNVLSIDSQSEWQNNGTLNGLEATTDGFLQLQSANTSGSYDSNNFANASDASRYTVLVNLPDPDNSSVELVVGSDTFQLEDGTNRVAVTGSSNFTLNFERDSTSVATPQVDSVTVLAGDTGGLLRLVGLAAFGLLLLLVVVHYLGVDLSVGRAR